MKCSVIDKMRVNIHIHTDHYTTQACMYALKKGNTPTSELDASSIWMN